MTIVRSPGFWGLERLPVNYSRGLRHDTSPIKPCCRLRFTSCMYGGGGGVCVGNGRARVLVGTRVAESVAFAPVQASPALAVVTCRS